MQQDLIDLLTQGSVWIKNGGKKAGVHSKVLWVTNTSLSEKIQEKRPPQVVYFDENGNVYNRPVSEFLENYSFYNIDPQLESKLENLVVFNEDDYDEDEVEAEKPVEVSNKVVEDKPVAEKVETVTLAEAIAYGTSEDQLETFEGNIEDLALDNSTTIAFSYSDGSDPSIASAVLSNAVVGYSQEPSSSLDHVHHKLVFRISKDVTLESLKNVFVPDTDQAIVDVIAVNGPFFSNVIAWNHFLGVYPDIAYGQAYAIVVLASYEDQDDMLPDTVVNELPAEIPTEPDSGVLQVLYPLVPEPNAVAVSEPGFEDSSAADKEESSEL